MYKYYFDGRKIRFYPLAVVYGEKIYGAQDEAAAERFKARLRRIYEELPQSNETEGNEFDVEMIELDMPTVGQFEKIEARTFDDAREAMAFAESVLSGEEKPTQEEINARVMLELAKLKAGVLNV